MITRGQIYRSAKPTYHGIEGDEYTRIQVVSVLGSIWNAGSVMVATIRQDGKLIRQRWILMSQLHATATTKFGEPRKTGWILVAE